MPLVRIDIKKNSDGSYIKKLGRVVYEAMKAAINVPDKDNFQVLTEHDDNHFVYDSAYLGIERTDGTVFIQITLNEGPGPPHSECIFPDRIATWK